MPATFFGSAYARRAATISGAVIRMLQRGILHAQQEQPLGGGGGARTPRQGRHAGQVAAPTFDECPHDVADHMFEEAGAAHAVNEAAWGALQDRGENGRSEERRV